MLLPCYCASVAMLLQCCCDAVVMLCHTIQCYAMLSYAMLCYAMPCQGMPEFAMLRRATPCYEILHLCMAMLHSFWQCWMEPCSALQTANNHLDGNSWIQFNKVGQSLRCQPAAENPLRVGLQLLQHLLLLGWQQGPCKGLLQ